MAGPSKMKAVRIACPAQLIFPFIQEYMDTGKWRIIQTDPSVNYICSKRRGLVSDAMILEVTIEPLGAEAPNETLINMGSSFDSTKVFAGGALQKAIDEFEEAVATKAREFIKSGQASANQWRPNV